MKSVIRNQAAPAPVFRLFFYLFATFSTFACGDAPPPRSPSSDVREVYTQRAEDKPDFVKLERNGDDTPALAAAYAHGASARISQTLGHAVEQQLRNAGYDVTVRPAEGAILLSLPLATANARTAVTAVRDALLNAFVEGSRSLPGGEAPGLDALSPCGHGISRTPAAPGRRNTVLAAVGSADVLGAIAGAYETGPAWPAGEGPETALPAHDEYVAQPGAAPAEIVIAVRTPARERVIPAARFVTATNSLLGLLARSHDGAWGVASADASFVPGGGCLTVRLTAHQAVTALYAARAAKAVSRELEWTLDNEVTDEDTRFNVIEATSAEQAALRAAWEALTARGIGETAPVSRFIAYRGPHIDAATWTRLLEAESAPPPLPVVSADEAGQGRVWAALGSRCADTSEDTTTAGHAAGALLAAAHATSADKVSPFASRDRLGLVAWQPTRSSGAEDRVAQELARSLLQVMVTPSVANRVERQPPSELDSPPWTLALTLATGGHPSWLSRRSTPQSRGLFDSDSLGHAMRSFFNSPLELAVLTNQGPAQAERIGARLGHLLSGVYSAPSQCPSGPTAAGREPPAGEYDVESPEHLSAVLLYVLDRRFSVSVRQLSAALNHPKGWLSRSVGPLGANAQAVGLGTPTTLAALGISLSAESLDSLSRAIDQVRMLITDLPKAPVASLPVPAEPRRSTPEARLLHLFSERSAAETSEASLSELIGEGLTERRLFIVRPLLELPPRAPGKRRP